ncbi:hypothetical protein [Lentzea sp. NPDC059081]|uniref:hypothetical protein n=1 Tax=Lentzea sp. NPDC059081 TaxID=3346719 RepID=UPI0036A80EE7
MSRPDGTEQDMKRAALAGEVLDLSRRGNNVLRAEAIEDLLQAGGLSPVGLQVSGARITGRLALDFLRSTAPLLLDACLFEEPLSFFHAELPALSLDDSTMPGISAEGLRTGYLTLRDARCTGVLDLDNARIDGPLLLDGSSLRGISGGSMHVSRDVWMRRVLITAKGVGCWFDSCEIGTDLVLENAVVDAAETALNLNGAQIGGMVRVNDSFLRASREGDAFVSLDASARGIVMTRTVLRSNSGNALCADGAHLRAGLALLDGFDALSHGTEDTVRMVNARLGGALVLKGSVRSRAAQAISVHRAAVDGNLLLNADLVEAKSVLAAVEVSDSDIGGELAVLPAEVVNRGRGLALDLFSTRAGRALQIDVPALVAGRRFAVTLNGLTYPEPPDDTGAWLRMFRDHTTRYEAQPYQQLAAVHRAAGHEHTARKVLIAQQRDLRRRGDPGNKLWHWFLGVTLGYGYKPSRAVAGLLVTFLLAIGLVWTAGAQNGLTPAKDRPADSCSPVNRISLAADLAIPLVKLGGTPRCELANGPAGQWATGAGWVVQILGWSFATLSVAGFTGLVRKS